MDMQNKFHILESVAAPEIPFPVPFPEEQSVYNYRFVKEDFGQWVPWTDAIKDAPAIPKVIKCFFLPVHMHTISPYRMLNLTPSLCRQWIRSDTHS